MSNSSKKWAALAAVVGGLVFQLGGCSWLGGQWQWVWAILNEDIFG